MKQKRTRGKEKQDRKFTMRIDDATLKSIHHFARRTGITASEVMRVGAVYVMNGAVRLR